MCVPSAGFHPWSRVLRVPSTGYLHGLRKHRVPSAERSRATRTAAGNHVIM
nr:MAG TPA: hypothetical protein [Caudoviricetes sp.]